jgi:hypothetical protein
MDYNRNKKYFEQHLSTTPIIVSAACFAIGFLMVVILSGTRGFNTYMMISGGLTFIAIGAAIFLVRAAKKIPDNEISEQARKLYDTFKDDVLGSEFNKILASYKAELEFSLNDYGKSINILEIE